MALDAFLATPTGASLIGYAADGSRGYAVYSLANKGMGLKAIAKALTRSEESIQARAKLDGLAIAKLR